MDFKKTETNKKNDKNHKEDFGKVIDALHDKKKLQSLRTYQGDVAEFIKEKDQSVASIVLKEKERKEKREELEIKEKPKSEGGLKKNALSLTISAILIILGIGASFYAYKNFQREPAPIIISENEIIPPGKIIKINVANREELGEMLEKADLSNGVNIMKISNQENVELKTAPDFIKQLKLKLPSALQRILEEKYALGVLKKDENKNNFIIFLVNDFGRGFSSMLEWENSIEKDLYFINTKQINIATSAEPLKTWKDLIVKNKDTRALVDERENIYLIYTFLDKNTILITDKKEAISEISSIYFSKSFTR